MHFKKLEIVGFKSFLNKTKLKFEPGVTAIVGPNGCGKSNVVDAIKWVLGEQSPKSMRGTAMQDVIFNGTEKHDPVNMAEVSLTLANEDRSLPVDYDEVTITRRLFRSGESEYLLNKTTVRLQDIRNVLLGTGIGTSLYSIVEQGRMDMIISSRPDDRRHIFEEASGITKFKMKKKEAMFRLDRTQENLQRINDIIREVERQINSIERQARKAERYKVRFDELKDLEVRMSYKRYNEIGRDDASLLHEHEALKHAISDLSAETARASERLEALREEFSATMDEMQIAQAEIMKLSSEIDKNSHVEQVDRERIQELQKFVERLDFEIEQATERKDTMNVRLEGLDKKLVEVREGRKSKESELSAAEENAKDVSGKLESHKERLKDNREKTMDLLGRETRAKNALIRVSADIQNMQSRERRLRSDRQQTLSDKERAETELAGLTERLGAVGGELDSRKKEFDLFSDDYSAKQDRVRGLTSDRALKEKKLNEIRPRREFLEKLVNEREGLPESIKEIMRRLDENDGRFKGVHGVLSELVSVDFEYAGSVESVLGDISRALVVENREVAESVSAYLKEKNLPSACFAILDELKAILTEGKSGEIKKGTLDDVTQVIAAREPYSSAVEALLSGTFITVSSDAAKMLIGDAGFSGRIIGERGEVFSRGTHRSRDYSNNEAVSLFGRQEKIKQLKDEEEALVSAVKLGTEEINELEAWLREASRRKERMEDGIREKQIEFSNIASKKALVGEKVDSINEEMVLLDAEMQEEEALIKNACEETEKLNSEIRSVEAESVKVNEEIHESQSAITELTTYREETLYLIMDVKAELYGLRKEEENLTENLSREKETFIRVKQEVDERRSRIAESADRIRTLEAEIGDLAARNKELKSELAVMEQGIGSRKARKEHLSELIAVEEKKLGTTQNELEEARNKARDMDISGKELEYRKNSILERIRETYKMDLAELSLTLDENTDWEEVDRKISELKIQLENMGEVSLGAVEELRELEERFQFLTKQRDDLVNAKDSLMDAIQKINRTTRTMFMESFEAIRKEFNTYFRMLFNGGKADLILQDETNVLECGIDIEVRPPGKKLHNIMQLSGGEKAMTATALIFAIFKVNPSPFCILDEIDAPLDESNIVRFCRVLQEFLKLSQFIVVTHNRMTIQLADVLYGITMQEKGVSQVVSVKFGSEKEKEITAAENVAAAA